MKLNERLLALNILTQLFQEKKPLSHFRHALDGSPLSQKICFGVCRYYDRLEALADCLLNQRPKTTEVWISILMGLYQLYDLRTPKYAVVQETVALLETIKKPWAKGFVNAVLRSYCREQKTLSARLKDHVCFRYNHPLWFIKRVQKDWPHDWQAILRANDTHPPMSLRVNRARTTVEAYLRRLKKAGMSARRHKHAPYGLELSKPCDVHDLPAFAEGVVSVQDEAAQLAGSLLALKPGIRLLDACCAPGGKTGLILETQPNLSTCVALDIDAKRLKRVQDNLNRLHLQASLIQGNALKPQTWWDGKRFDRILLDAPCSATGVIRRHPDIKIRRKETDIATIVTLQQDLLQALWPLLASNGILIYATCSVMPEENEQQIAHFMATQLDCRFLDHKPAWGRATNHGWQILPGDDHMDGFFYSALTKIC